MIGADDRNFSRAAHVLDQRIVIAVTVNSISFVDELYCGFSAGVGSSELPTFRAAFHRKMVGG